MTRSKDSLRFAVLACAAVLLVVSNGRWIFPFAPWLAPLLWLRFAEEARSRRELAGGFAVYAAVFLVAWYGLVPAPPAVYTAIVLVYALAYFVPYLLHRLLAPRFTGLVATAIFPLAWVSVELLFQTLVTPYGSWFSLAYSQASNLPLAQLASVTGLAGISFLMTWTASVAASVWRTRQWSSIRVPVCATLAVLLLVHAAGELRLRRPRPNAAAPIRVAAIVPNPLLEARLQKELSRFRRARGTRPEGDVALVAAAEALNADLIARTRREAAAGASVIAWAELAGRLIHVHEPAFLQRLARLGAETRAHVLAGYGTYEHGRKKPIRNRVAAVDPQGRIAWIFDKAHPITGGESSMLEAGDGRLRAFDGAGTTMTLAICHDFDFPPLIRQASALGATLLIAPSADWRRITAMHANMALMRAIENGMPLVRPTSGGRTLITDAMGVTLARQDHAADAVVASVRPMRIATIYGRVGDLFAWLCVAIFAGLMVKTMRRSARVMTAREAVAATVVAIALTAMPLAAAGTTPLQQADAALESCIAAAKAGKKDAAIKAADEADRLYTAAERASAPRADVLTGRARVLTQCRVQFAGFLKQPGLVKESNALLERAIAADPHHFLSRLALGMNHYFAPRVFGQTENALAQFEFIVKQWGSSRDQPLVGDAYYFLGRCYERLDRRADAEAAWRRGRELFPANARLQRVKK